MKKQTLINKFKKKKSILNTIPELITSKYTNKKVFSNSALNSEETKEKKPYFPGIYNNFPGGIPEANIETFRLLSESSDRLLAENNDILNS